MYIPGTHWQYSDLLEQLAHRQDKELGKDIADYLIKQDWRLFRKQEIKEPLNTEPDTIENSKSEKSEFSERKNKTFIEAKKVELSKSQILKPYFSKRLEVKNNYGPFNGNQFNCTKKSNF